MSWELGEVHLSAALGWEQCVCASVCVMSVGAKHILLPSGLI